MATSDPVERAKKYASHTWALDCQRISAESQQARLELQQHSAGPDHLSATVAHSYVEQLEKLIEARVDSLLDGFELYGVFVTPELEQYIIRQANNVRLHGLESIRQAATTPGSVILLTALQQLDWLPLPTGAIRAQVEERHVRPKIAAARAGGIHDAYVVPNLAGIDTPSPEVSSDELFSQLRLAIQSSFAGKGCDTIVGKLNEMEKAQETAAFTRLFAQFVSLIADDVTVLSRFLPALTQLLLAAAAASATQGHERATLQASAR